MTTGSTARIHRRGPVGDEVDLLLVGMRAEALLGLCRSAVAAGWDRVRICQDGSAAAAGLAAWRPALIAVDLAHAGRAMGDIEAIVRARPEQALAGVCCPPGQQAAYAVCGLRLCVTAEVAACEVVARLRRAVAQQRSQQRLEEALAGMEEMPTLDQIDRLLMREALRRSGGNQADAARLLGISRQAMHLRIRTPRAGIELTPLAQRAMADRDGRAATPAHPSLRPSASRDSADPER